MLEQLSPDVIAMDIRLPGMDGLEATRRIMSKKPVPIVVVAASVESGRWNAIPMEALRAGALTVLEKPVGTTNADYEALAERLCTQLVIMSQVKLVRQHGHREPHPANGRVPRALERRSRRVQDAGNCLLHGRAARAGATAGSAGTGLPFADPAGAAHDGQLHCRGSPPGWRASVRFR